jgi:hypothetical protein
MWLQQNSMKLIYNRAVMQMLSQLHSRLNLFIPAKKAKKLVALRRKAKL